MITVVSLPLTTQGISIVLKETFSSVEITIIGDVYGVGRYTAVTVEAPVGTTQADVDLCVTPGNTSYLNQKYLNIFLLHKSSF